MSADVKALGKVAVLMGGMSAERPISLMSGTGVLAAARGAFPGRRLVLAFQPHRYTRTRDCFEDFVKVIGTADAVLLTEVYSAGESPIVAADGRALARALRVAGKVDPVFVDDVAGLPAAVAEFAHGGDVVIAMGAGSMGSVPQKIVDLVGAAT